MLEIFNCFDLVPYSFIRLHFSRMNFANHRSVVSVVPEIDLVQLPLAMLSFRDFAPVPYGFNNLCSALFISVFQLQQNDSGDYGGSRGKPLVPKLN